MLYGSRQRQVKNAGRSRRSTTPRSRPDAPDGKNRGNQNETSLAAPEVLCSVFTHRGNRRMPVSMRIGLVGIGAVDGHSVGAAGNGQARPVRLPKKRRPNLRQSLNRARMARTVGVLAEIGVEQSGDGAHERTPPLGYRNPPPVPLREAIG